MLALVSLQSPETRQGIEQLNTRYKSAKYEAAKYEAAQRWQPVWLPTTTYPTDSMD